MNRLAVLLALTALVGLAAHTGAEEPSQVDFVRGLRARYGPRLAEEYLTRLRQQQVFEKEPRLWLEGARTKLELAASESNLTERIRLSQDARVDLDRFLKDPQHPELAAEARVILLQIGSLHGKALLGRALRQDALEQREAEALRAREVLVETAGQTQQLVQQIDAELLKKGEPKNPAERQARKALEDARQQAQLDLALNLFDQALTYVDRADRSLELLRQRTEILNKAQSALNRLAVPEAQNAISWQARAWIARCYQERDQPLEARKRYEELAKETNPAADAGRRLASGFRLLRLLQVLQGRAPADPGEKPEIEAQRLGEAWRRQYPGHLDTPEGFGVRMALAEAYRREAEHLAPARKKPVLEKARDLYREVERTDNEYAAAARQRKIEVVLALQGGDPVAMERVDVATLGTFDEFYLRAQFEASRLGKDADTYADDSGKLAEHRKLRYGRILQALGRALELAGQSGAPVQEEDLNGARLMLAYTCLVAGDAPRAIEIGEALARKNAAWSQASTAALYALQGYERLLAQPADASLNEEKRAEYRARQRGLAGHVIHTWPDDLAADVARHQLAVMYLQERQLPQAAELLAEVRPGYRGAILARYQLALTCFQLGDKNQPTPTDKDHRPWDQRGLAALEKLPALPEGASPDLARVYLLARLKLGELLFKSGKLTELEALTRELAASLARGTIKLDDEDRGPLVAGVYSLRLFAGLGQAEQAQQAGQGEEAQKSLDVVLALLEKEPASRDVLKKSDDLRRNLLDLALRIYFNNDQPARAAAVVSLVHQLEKEGGGTGVLEPALATLMQQLDDLRVKKRQEELARSEKRFESFLNTLTEQVKERDPGFVRLAAEGYASINKHDQACKLLAQLSPPAAAVADPREQRLYRLCRVLLIREQRLAGRLDEAEALLKALQNESGAGEMLELRVEELHLFDARGKHNLAYPGWDRLVARLASGIGQERARDLYFECYYSLVDSFYRYGQTQEETKKATVTRKAAGFIIDLESAWPELGGPASQLRFRKLLDAEKPLKAEYLKRKGK